MALVTSGRMSAVPVTASGIEIPLPRKKASGVHGHNGIVGNTTSTDAERIGRSWMMPHQIGMLPRLLQPCMHAT